MTKILSLTVRSPRFETLTLLERKRQFSINIRCYHLSRNTWWKTFN